MKDFSPLLCQKELKQEFIVSLMCHLSGLDEDIVLLKIQTLRSSSFSLYARISNISRELSKVEMFALEEGRCIYGDIDSGCKLFGISEFEFALWDKVHHIVFGLGDFSGAVRLLNSLDKGVKRLKNTDKTHGITPKPERAEWKESAHGEYLSMGANDPKAHFRWNYGKRYTLGKSILDKVHQFLCNHNLR